MPRSSHHVPKKRKRSEEPKSESDPDRVIELDPEDTPEPDWSPWDPTERKTLDFNDLDLNVSYDNEVSLRSNMARVNTGTRTSKTSPQRQRWAHKGRVSIQKIEDLPKDWHPTEPDLSPGDLDGQITRCRERIKDNIFPKYFKYKLRGLQNSKQYYDRLSENEPADLSLDVYQRIKTLRAVEREIQDPQGYQQLVNVKAVLQAYLDGELKWTPGLVTYWSKGIKLCEPRPFNWDEFETINQKICRSKSFWTEGLAGPGPLYEGASLIIGPSSAALAINLYRIAIRAPGNNWWDELEFVHDTGASVMHIYEGDIRRILGPNLGQGRRSLPVIGMHQIRTSTGTTTKDIVEIEATLLNEERRRILPWVRVQCVVNREPYVEGLTRRLDGPFLRSMMYTSTLPDGKFDLHVSTRQTKVNLHHTIPMKNRHTPLLNLVPPVPARTVPATGSSAQLKAIQSMKAMPIAHTSHYMPSDL